MNMLPRYSSPASSSIYLHLKLPLFLFQSLDRTTKILKANSVARFSAGSRICLEPRENAGRVIPGYSRVMEIAPRGYTNRERNITLRLFAGV